MQITDDQKKRLTDAYTHDDMLILISSLETYRKQLVEQHQQEIEMINTLVGELEECIHNP